MRKALKSPKTKLRYVQRHTRLDNSEQKRYSLICALLGWLGAINCLIIGFYILTSSTFLPTEQSLLEGYLATGLTTTSAIILTYGSYLMSKRKTRKGGIINLLAGTLIPVPVIAYFALYSQRILSWLGPLSIPLLAPPIISGTIAVLAYKET